MGRSPCCDKSGLKKGPWTPEEDMKLTQYIEAHGAGNWRNLPKNAGLQRCGKSCRLRWTNYLRPDIKRGRFSFEEEETIIQLHSLLGNKWSAIAERLPGRTDNEIKNYWNTHIRKRLLRMGIDPVTHAPRLDFFDLSSAFGGGAQPQLNLQSLLRLQTLLINPAALTQAMALVSSNGGDHSHLLAAPPIQPNQFEYIINQQTPAPTFNDDSSIQNQSQFFQDNLMPTTNASFPADLSSFDGYGVSDLSENSSFQSMNSTSNSNCSSSSHNNSNTNLDSVLSTPISSPHTFNSASEINGGGEDERESTFFSDLFKFEISESWDLDDFL